MFKKIALFLAVLLAPVMAQATTTLEISTAGTNLGIGTTSTSNTLSMNGGAAIGASYTSTTAPTDGLIVVGNVGIGTPNPGYKVQVNGNIDVLGSTAQSCWRTIAGGQQRCINGETANKFAFKILNGTYNQTLYVDIDSTSGDAIWSGVNNFVIDSSSNVGIGSLTPGTTLDVSGTLRASGHATLEGVTSTGATGTGNFVFATSPTFTTPALGTPSSGTLTNTTGLPEGGLSLTDITTNNSSTSKHGFLSKLDNNSAHYMDGTGTWSTPGGGGGSSQWLTTAGVGIGTYGNVGIGTVNPQGGLVVINGNVGIGTWTPTSGLEVVKQVAIDATGITGSNPFLTVGNNQLLVNGNGVGVGGDGSPDFNLEVIGSFGVSSSTNADGDLFYLNGNNNVGIGTKTAVNRLGVNGAVTIGGGYVTTTAPTGGLIVQGNVGVGTASTTSKMQIGGTCQAIGPVGTCWTATGQLGYCSGAANVCTTCTAC